MEATSSRPVPPGGEPFEPRRTRYIQQLNLSFRSISVENTLPPQIPKIAQLIFSWMTFSKRAANPSQKIETRI